MSDPICSSHLFHLFPRIARRFDAMLAAGFVEEVRRLRAAYDLGPEQPSMRCVGYRQAWQYLGGQVDEPTFQERGIAATRQLAKRQITWLRSWRGARVFDCQRPDLDEAVCGWLGERLGGD